MEEIRRVAVACGLPNFRYYSFPPVVFAATQAAIPEPMPLLVTENASVEAAAESMLKHPEVVLVTGKVVAKPLQPMTLPVAASYSLLTDVAEAGAGPQPAADSVAPPLIKRNIAQSQSQPTRRRARPAGRAALAATGQI